MANECSGSICQRSWSTLTLISRSDIASSTSVCEGHTVKHCWGRTRRAHLHRGRWEPVPKAGAAFLDQAGALEGKLWLPRQKSKLIMLLLSLCLHPPLPVQTVLEHRRTEVQWVRMKACSLTPPGWTVQKASQKPSEHTWSWFSSSVYSRWGAKRGPSHGRLPNYTEIQWTKISMATR